jgi:Domain of unknown function (DUF4430)
MDMATQQTLQLRNTVSLKIADPNGGPPSLFENIPWFAGMTILEAMLITQGMYEPGFRFQVEYNSFFGAFVNSIDGTPDQENNFWIVQINGKDCDLGVSEAIIFEQPNQNVEVEWQYRDITQQAKSRQIDQKMLSGA